MPANSHRQRFARETSVLGFCLFLICFIDLLSLTKSESCNEGYDCKPLGECKAFKEMNNIDLKHRTWCNITAFVICCPHVHLAPAAPSPERARRIFEKECKKWQQAIYAKCPAEGLIVNGRNATAKEFPHMALVGIYQDFKYDWFCGGSLISPKFVLTAAHCIKVEGGKIPNRVRLGELDYNSIADQANIQEFTIKNFTVHEKYDAAYESFDIALIELAEVALLNDFVTPICLPNTNGSEHDQLYVAGWGHLQYDRERASHLQKVKLTRFGDRECRRRFKKLNYTMQICAGSYFDSKDTCQADSGGPLFIEHPYYSCMFEIQGITSFGTSPRCGEPGLPGIYTRVLPYVNWIERIVWNETNIN